MPTFFGRKYMRGKPGSTERRVGVFVLLLLGAIVGLFLLTGGLFQEFVDTHPVLARARDFFGISRRPLFVADPANLPAPAPSRDVRVAETLLPARLESLKLVGGEPGVYACQTDADLASLKQAGCDPELLNAVKAGGARRVYAKRYGVFDPKSLAAQVVIADLGEPIGAASVCKARMPAEAKPLAVGRGGWLANRRAGFWSGRYYTEVGAVDAESPSAESLARTLAGFQLSYGVPFATSAPAPAEKADKPAHVALSPGAARFAEVAGGRIVPPAKVERYAENLYEKIDGKESAFRAFFVVDLKFAQYLDPESQQVYDAYIYDMAAPANAFGIYMSERVPNAVVASVGRDGYVSGTSVFFWKGRYYINVLGPPDSGEAGLNVSKQIALSIAGTIADDGEPFWADKVLPAEDRVPFTFSYQATNALGYEFLSRMWFARYETGGKSLQMFIAKAADTAAARAWFEQFAKSVERYDKVLGRDTLEKGELLRSESPMPNRPSKFGAAFCKGSYFGGVTGSSDRELAAVRVKMLFDRLSANDPGDPAAAAAPVPASGDSDHETPASEGESSGASGSEGGESEH